LAALVRGGLAAVFVLVVGAGCTGSAPIAAAPTNLPIPTISVQSIAPQPALPTAEPSPSPTPEPSPSPTVAVLSAVAPPQLQAPAVLYRVAIARLGIDLPIAEGDLGRDVERAQTPEHYAFHLPGTSLFGPGNTYIYAHARVGMFLSLWNVRVGDVVVIQTPNGPREYLVAEIHPRVPPTEVSWAQQTQDTRLTLQTSTGPNGSDPRFVVVARPR
jgi:sortase (surface protein transpeptidase)